MATDNRDEAQMRSSEQALLEVLRRRTGAPELRYARPPVRLAGGFWAEILAVRLEGAPPELDRDLIVRIMPDETTAQRETIVQAGVVAQGFPAPPIRLAGGPDDGLGRAYMVMDFATGRPPLAGLEGRAFLADLPRIVIKLPDLLARVSAQLHALDPGPVRASLESVSGAVFDVWTALEHLKRLALAADRPDLAGVASWMESHSPPVEPAVICHGDLHPFNLLVDGDMITVIDWSVALVAHPAFDLGYTSMILAMPPLSLPGALRRIVRAGGRGMSRRFLSAYRRHASSTVEITGGVLDWYTGLHCLRALVEAADWVYAGTVAQRQGHPWLTLAPEMATRLSLLSGRSIRPLQT
jgi:aminoglycoside phosphotransferase (APT) family kinase protein